MFGKLFITILVLPIIPSYIFFTIFISLNLCNIMKLIEMYDHSKMLSKLLTLDNK